MDLEKRSKIFSEQEATDLVLEAAKLQEEGPSTIEGGYTPGVNYEELRKMAAELGVDEVHLKRAIENRQSEPKAVAEKKWRWGLVPYAKTYEAVLEGELPPDRFDIILDDLVQPGETGVGHMGIGPMGMGMRARRRMRYQTAPVQIGRTVKGTMQSGWGSAQVTVISRNGRTKVTAESNALLNEYRSWGLFFALWVIGTSTSKEIVANGILGGVLAVVFAVGAFLAANWFAKSGHESVKNKFDGLVSKIEEEIEVVQDEGSLRDNVAQTSEPSLNPDQSVPDQA